MADEVRLWQIGGDNSLTGISSAKLDLESRLEEWLVRDIAVLDPELWVIGRQVETDFGGRIDLVCMDAAGNLAIVELKRDKTPREITAQALDYASWVSALSNERLSAIAADYLNSDLETAFRKRFTSELPETLNADHRMLIVGSEIDPSSERIIRYLSEVHGVNINAATFHYFRTPDGSELLARVFLIEPSEVEHHIRTKGASKRRPNLTYEELWVLAADHGVGDLYEHAVSRFESLLHKHTTRSSIGFTATLDERRKTILSLLPGESSPDHGLRFQLYKNRFGALTGLPAEQVTPLVPAAKREDWSYDTTDPDYDGFQAFMVDKTEIDRIADALRWPQSGSGPQSDPPEGH